MRFCQNCGNPVSDDAKFCGKCAQPLSPSGGKGRMSFGGGGSGGEPKGAGIISIAQGVLMLATVPASLLLPVLEMNPLLNNKATVELGFNVSFNILSLVAPSIPYSQMGKLVAQSMGSSSEKIVTAQLTDALNKFGFSMTIVGLLLVVALVATFITAARCLERTSKSTLITGWLYVPYALVSMIVLGGTAASINDFIRSAAVESAGSAVSGMIPDAFTTTFWPWVVLVLAVLCGVLGVLRHIAMRQSR